MPGRNPGGLYRVSSTTEPGIEQQHWEPPLKHPIQILGCLRHLLPHIPVLHDIAGFKPEDVDDGDAGFSGFALGLHVQDDEVALGEDLADVLLEECFKRDIDIDPIVALGL